MTERLGNAVVVTAAAAVTLTNAGSSCYNIALTKNAEKISEFYILPTACKPSSLTYHMLD